jgi:hypothetical protein
MSFDFGKRRFQYPKVNGEEIEREESFVGLGNGFRQFINSTSGSLNKIRIFLSHYFSSMISSQFFEPLMHRFWDDSERFKNHSYNRGES